MVYFFMISVGTVREGIIAFICCFIGAKEIAYVFKPLQLLEFLEKYYKKRDNYRFLDSYQN